MKKFFIAIGIFSLSSFCFNLADAYYFGLKSADNSVGNIQSIEADFGVHLPIVSFIFDPREDSNVLEKLDAIAEILGTTRIYHITVSPNMYSAKEVTEGAFDAQYLQFFEKIKEKNLKVIFRTMHEMNGGRYPRSSNPTAFKQARTHVRELSRAVGLDQNDILFDFSVNHWDMPTKGKPSQTASLYECKPVKPTTKTTATSGTKAEEPTTKSTRKECPRFEDYYPGDAYVDIVGFTFYNRGKATSNRLRLTPKEILFDKEWQTYERIKALGKPIVIDEVGTTTVWYGEKYSAEKSRTAYINDTEKKEIWLGQLQSFLVAHPEILATVYFNVDYTYGLTFPTVWEADWAIIDPEQGKVYQGFFDLYQYSETSLQDLLKHFMNASLLHIDEKEVIVSSNVKKEVSVISGLISKKAETIEEKSALVDKLIALKISDWKIQKSLSILKGVYK